MEGESTCRGRRSSGDVLILSWKAASAWGGGWDVSGRTRKCGYYCRCHFFRELGILVVVKESQICRLQRYF